MAANPHAEHLQELLEDLNEPQREAVTHGEGPLLILAGAGSGKTRVLAHRIAFLIYTDQAQAGEILAITFTNKAASEMRERVERLLGHATRGMWLMTFHSACARILRAEAARLGYTRQFTIYDQADSRRLAKRSADAVGVDPKRYTPAAVLNQISAAKNKLIDVDAYREQAASPFEEMIGEVYDIYQRDLVRMNAMDFDDLLFRTVNLLELFEEARERYTRDLPPRARRRVPGHQPRAVPAAAAARRRRARRRSAGRAGAATARPTRARSGIATWRSSAMTRSRSTASAAPTSATSSTSRRTSPTRAW